MRKTFHAGAFQQLNKPGSYNCLTLWLSGTLFVFLIHFLFIPGSFASSVLWQYQPIAGYVDASPAVADLDGDDIPDIVLCTTAGRITALDANGKPKWYFDTGQTISNPPTITDVNNHPKVYAMTNPGKIVCLDGKSGGKIWEVNLPGKVDWGTTAIVAADVNGDGDIELVAADRDGHLTCLKEDGTLAWTVTHDHGINTAPALADLDGDGQLEILVGTKASPLVCFTNVGKERWRLQQQGAAGSSPVIVDLNGDQQPEILIGQDNGLALVSHTGKILWHWRMKKPVHDAIAAADFDDDGRIEIVVVDLSGHVACLAPDGILKWSANVEQRVRRSPAIADLDGDSTPEIVIGGYSAALHIFDPSGNLKERFPLPAAMNASPTIVDFRGNDRLAVVCATGANVVALSFLHAEPVAKAPILWSEYRVNSARTGSTLQAVSTRRLRIVDIDYGKLYVGSNDFSVTVANPHQQRLQLQLEVSQDNGVPVVSKHISSDTMFTHTLAYAVPGQAAVNLKLVCKLQEGKKLVAMREKAFYLIPFAKDIADLWQALADIEKIIAAVPDQEYATDHLTLLQGRPVQLESRVKLAGTLPAIELGALREDISVTRAKVTRWLAMTRAAAKAGNTLAGYGANPWAPFGGIDEIVEGRTGPAQLTVACFGGDTEAAALNLANFSSKAVIVRLETEPIRSQEDSSKIVPAQNVFSFHKVLAVPTQSLDYAADALPLMDQARTLVIPAWEVQQVWINVNPGDLQPGDWLTTLRFRSLEVEPKQVTASLSIKVWPHRLPSQLPLRLCHWGYVHTSILKDQPEAALDDQVRHGTNVFVATNQFAPKANFDQDGNIIDTLDFTEHDAYVQRHSPHGVILFFNYQANLTGPAARFTPIWEKAYKEWLKRWITHLRQLGLSYQDYAFYPIDEPGLNEGLVDEFIGYARPVREVEANVQIYTDPVGRATMVDLQRMAPYVDIWCPNRNGYLLDQGADKLSFIKATGKTVWTYECDGNAKHQSPLGYYRSQAWLVWHHGLTGIGFWSYCTSQYDPWYLPIGGQDYLLIYHGTGVVTSKRWEAVRDGVEDYGMLAQLQEAVKKASARPELASAIQIAKKLLTADASAIAQYCGLDEAGTVPGLTGMAYLRQVEDSRWQKIQDTRREIARLLEKLVQE